MRNQDKAALAAVGIGLGVLILTRRAEAEEPTGDVTNFNLEEGTMEIAGMSLIGGQAVAAGPAVQIYTGDAFATLLDLANTSGVAWDFGVEVAIGTNNPDGSFTKAWGVQRTVPIPAHGTVSIRVDMTAEQAGLWDARALICKNFSGGAPVEIYDAVMLEDTLSVVALEPIGEIVTFDLKITETGRPPLPISLNAAFKAVVTVRNIGNVAYPFPVLVQIGKVVGSTFQPVAGWYASGQTPSLPPSTELETLDYSINLNLQAIQEGIYDARAIICHGLSGDVPTQVYDAVVITNALDVRPTGQLSACPPVGDIDGDGIITYHDVDALAALVNRGPPYSADELLRGDVNGDGVLNVLDFILFGQLVGTGVSPIVWPACSPRGDVTGLNLE